MNVEETSAPAVRISRWVLAISPDADPATALLVMRKNAVRHLPVVRGHGCIGLLTEAHLLQALADVNPPPVGVLCQRPAPTVPAGSALGTVAAAILAGGLDAVLVVSDAVLVGIVTSADVLAQVAEQAGNGNEERHDQ